MTQRTLFQKPLDSRGELNALVDKAADIIRTATDYKFILVLLLMKRMSDVWKDEFEEKKKELIEKFGLNRNAAEREAEKDVYHTYNLRRGLLWEEVTKDVRRLPENLSNALREVAELNEELKGILDRFNFLEFTVQEHREKLRQLVELFNRYNLGKQIPSDIVGDAYEHILYRFAPTQAKQGEVYTPREVIRLLVEILDPKPGEEVYDPACGSGGMLIYSFKHVRDAYGEDEAESLFLYGQEYNQDIYAICKMNLLAHGIPDPFIEFGDSLLYPRFTEGGRLKRFDVVLINPPWNQDGYGEETLKRADFRERFSFGYPPNNSADWAWIQHVLATTKKRAGVVIDNGALFRGGREKQIRRKVLERDLVECVILLPEKLFYNTGAPGAILIFNKNKPAERKGKVLFINASTEYEQHPEVKKLNRLGQRHIEKIVEAYREFKSVEGFSRVVPLDEIKENDYNLNVTLYVFPREEVEKIDVAKEWEELRRIEEEIKEVEKRIEGYLEELGMT